MSISKKNKRKVSIDDRLFYWWVRQDRDGPYTLLSILSEDRCFYIVYALGQASSYHTPVLEVRGKEFPGLPNAGRGVKRVQTPQWDDDIAITPAFVRQLIHWSLDEKREIIQVDARGNIALKN